MVDLSYVHDGPFHDQDHSRSASAMTDSCSVRFLWQLLSSLAHAMLVRLSAPFVSLNYAGAITQMYHHRPKKRERERQFITSIQMEREREAIYHLDPNGWCDNPMIC